MTTSTYNGSDFVGIDEEAVGDGQDDTQPIDTWVQHRIQANIEYLAQEPRLLCWSPVIANADDLATVGAIRPYTHVNTWGSVWVGEVPIFKDQTGLKLTLAYTSFTIGGTGAGDAEAQLWLDLGRGVIAEATFDLAETETAGSPDVGVATLELTFPAPVTVTGRATLFLRVQTSLDTDVATTIGPSSNGIVAWGGNGYTWHGMLADSGTLTNRFWAPNPTSNPSVVPTTSSRECMVARLDDLDDSIPQTDLLVNLTAVGEFNNGGTFARTLEDQLTQYVEQGNIAYTALLAQSVWIRAAAIEPVFSANSLTVERGRFFANQQFGSAEAFRQFSAAKTLHLRPRLIKIGPRGFKDRGMTKYWELGKVTDSSQGGYAIHWPFVMGDASPGIDEIVIDESVYLQTENPELEIRCAFIQVQHGAQNNLRDDARSGSIGDKKHPDPVDSSPLGRATWTFQIDLDQMNDKVGGGATWAANSTTHSVTVADRNAVIPIHPTSLDFGVGGQPSLISGLEHMMSGDKSAGAEAHLWFKEGSLFDGDAGVLHVETFRLQTTGVTTQTNRRPYRLQMSASWNSTQDWLRRNYPSGTTPQSQLRLVLVSYSVHEVPQDPSRTASAAINQVDEDALPSFGLTTAQFSNSALKFAWRAKAEMVHARISATSTDWDQTTSHTPADGEEVYALLDASPSQFQPVEWSVSTGPIWDTTPSGASARAVRFRGNPDQLVWSNSRDVWDFLHDDSTSFTIILRLAINHDATANDGVILWSGAASGTGIYLAYEGASGTDLRFGVDGSGSFQSVNYTTWAGFTTNQVYTIAVKHNMGSTTSLYVDDMGTPVASGSITNWTSGVSSRDMQMGGLNGLKYGQFELLGMAILREAATEAEMDALVAWMDASQA